MKAAQPSSKATSPSAITTFRGSIGDAVALLPNGIVEQFKDNLPKAQPYDATTYRLSYQHLRDALERVTTACKINLKEFRRLC